MSKYSSIGRKQLAPFFLMITILLIFIAFTAYAYEEPAGTDKIPATNGVKNSDSPYFPQFDGPLYLDFTLPKTRFYLGERAPVKISLYIRGLNVNGVDQPVLNQPEFLLDELNNTSQEELRINGQECHIINFSYLLTPVQAGTFKLGPIRLTCSMYTPNNNIKRRVEVASKKITVNVLSLPNAGRPNDFSGGIGGFQMKVSAEPRQVLQGEPITIRLTISGYGSLRNVMPPYLSNTTGLKVYTAQKKPELTDSNGSWEKITFEQAIFPLNPSLKKISPYVFTYFNPSTGRYQRLDSTVIPILVKPNPQLKPDQSQPSELRSLAPKMVSIKKEPGKLSLITPGLLNQPWFWIWQLVPLLFLTGALFYRKHVDMMQSDTLQARAIRANNKAERDLAKARITLNNGKYDELLDELHQILREYLGEKFQLPSAGMTITVIHLLENHEIPAETLKDIQWFFEQYDLYRFTGTKLDPDESLKLWKLISLIIGELNQTKDSKDNSRSSQMELSLTERRRSNGNK